MDLDGVHILIYNLIAKIISNLRAVTESGLHVLEEVDSTTHASVEMNDTSFQTTQDEGAAI